MKPRAFPLVLALLSASTVAWADAADHQHGQGQQKIVSRFYDLTDGMLRYCDSVPEEQRLAHAAAVDSFWLKYPEFEKLLRSSPYYPAAVDSQEHAQTAAQRGMDPQIHRDECAYYQRLVQEYVDDPDGRLQARVGEMTDTLTGATHDIEP